MPRCRDEFVRMTALRLWDLPTGVQRACAIPSGKAEWYGFARAYKEAADQLATAIATDPGRHFALAAPMLFLYRHSIELHLKSLLIDAGELLDEPQVVPSKHYIANLWKRVRDMLRRISPGTDSAWFVRADAIIADCDDLDEGSFACRYPVDTRGAPSLPADFNVDASVVQQIVSELDVLLDGASALISAYTGLKQEMP